MAFFRVFKETTLPGTVVGHAIYLVAPVGSPDYVEMYVTNADATVTRRVITSDDVQDMINASISAAGGMALVDNIAARNALTPINGQHVLVLDASADPTVAAGAASYVWRESNTTWIKLTEFESLDVELAWASITGAPTSSVAAIDAAVSNAHTHANKTQIDKVGEDGEGNFTYNSNPPRARLESAVW
jgi:hypothetical protein